MKERLRRLVAMAHVESVTRSIEFYTQLGFGVVNTVPEGSSEPTWAFLESSEARLMLAKATAPVVPDQQAVLFYLYFDDILSVHADLKSRGLRVGGLKFPFYCPKGEFYLADPDGYCLMLTHA